MMPNRFMLILEDNIESGQLDLAGIQQPEEHNDESPAHIVGQFLKDNMPLVIDAAQKEWAMKKRLSSVAARADKLVLPASQHGLVGTRSVILDSNGNGVS